MSDIQLEPRSGYQPAGISVKGPVNCWPGRILSTAVSYRYRREIAMSPRFSVLTLVTLLLLSSASAAQEPDSGPLLWSAVAPGNKSLGPDGDRLPNKYALFGLDVEALGHSLARAPMEFVKSGASQPVIELPTPDGGLARFLFEESPILSAELSREYPEIRSFRAQGLDDSTLTARFDLTSSGFHAIVFSPGGVSLVDPLPGETGLYMAYRKRDARGAEPFRCLVEGDAGDDRRPFDLMPKISPNNPSGTQLRTYRLAVTATDEYTAWAGGTTQAQNQIVTTFNRVTGIYERDLSISFIINCFNIYPNDSSNPDPFTNSVNSALLNANDADLDTNCGSGNYDLGHLLSQGGGGGLAGVGACKDSKGRGATSRGNPSGDAFDVDYVSHEVGHQMGAAHTFNGTTGSCGGGNRSATSAYEPGSGTTIMAYAGICGGEDVQANSDDDFHTRSFDQIRAYQAGDGACGTTVGTGNVVPIVNAGPDYTIPQDTPFTLTASGSDGNSDALTYAWEQYDLGAATSAPPTGTSTGPLFRARPRTSDPSRTLPRMADLLLGASTPWEVLPTVDRTLNFRVTARDNRAGGGGVDWDAMQITVAGDPFRFVSPLGGDLLECGSDDSIEWLVGGGSVAASIEASFSSDDGANFSTALASTPNDGDAEVTVPQTLTTNGRYKLEAIGNIFFDVSGRFSIEDSLNPLIAAPADLIGVECTSPAGASPALSSPTVSDLCDTSPVVTDDSPAHFPLGATEVTWTATDASGNSASDFQQVTVVDTTSPTITAPVDVTAECTSPAGTPVSLGSPTVSDVCDASPTVSDDAPPLFPLGPTLVSWTANDTSGNVSSDGQTITIEDTTPPEFTTLELSPTVLWPPNHNLVTVEATIVVEDICDAATQVRLVSITTNQPDDDLGDGATTADIQGANFGTDDRQFQLRAERSGVGRGPRIYTVVYEVADASGNVTQGSVEVVVPFSRRMRP